MDGIDARYEMWLWVYDADVIYSFVGLTDGSVAAVHEKYAPAYLTFHVERGARDQQRSFRIDLPIACAPSLSVLSAFKSQRWGFSGPPRNIQVLTKYFDRSESAFLQENFGFVRTSFPMGGAGMPFPEIYSPLSLITVEALADPRNAKEQGAEYLTDEASILDRLAERNPDATILTLANVSNFFSPYLGTGEQSWSDGVSLVLGDSVDDRLLFWNGCHRAGGVGLGEVATLRVPAARVDERDLLNRVGAIIQMRGKRGPQGQTIATLRSCSLSLEQLQPIAANLRGALGHVGIRAAHHDGHAVCVPELRHPDRVFYHWGSFFNNQESQAATEFTGQRFIVPRPIPWHIREALPPSGLRHGSWMVDLVIDRHVDHSRYSNQRDSWVLPRRLRLDGAFVLEGGDGGTRSELVLRVTRHGSLALPLRYDQANLALTAPEDTDAFRQALSPMAEWSPFDRSREQPPVARLRFAYSEPSDKGRYLLGVLGRFTTLSDAFHSLMHGFWQDVLLDLGAAPERSIPLRQELITVLRRRLGQRVGDLTFSTPEQLDRLGAEALRIAQRLRRERRFIRYEDLKARWDAEVVDPFLREHPAQGGEDDDYYRSEARLEQFLQHLCQCELLFQGREWQCRRCYNRNWVTINEMKRTLICEVCGSTEPAPVAAGWHFRGNPFVIDAYREHGTEAVIWALWQLWQRAKRSFYFAPSLSLWLNYPAQGGAGSDAEIDALAVVDGKLYLCEGKSSVGLDAGEIQQLTLAAERIRPDVVLIACFDERTEAMRRSVAALAARVGDGIEVELLDFRPEMLERLPYV